MECMNCGWDSKDWKDITKDCKVEMELTKPDEDLGYILLKYRDITIGSFDGESFSYNEHNPTPDFIKPKYKVLIIHKPKYHQYFKVFRKE